MRLVRLRAPGGLENLKLVEEDHPKPRPSELLVRGIESLDSSARKLLGADADEAELAVPGILAVIEEGQE